MLDDNSRDGLTGKVITLYKDKRKQLVIRMFYECWIEISSIKVISKQSSINVPEELEMVHCGIFINTLQSIFCLSVYRKKSALHIDRVCRWVKILSISNSKKNHEAMTNITLQFTEISEGTARAKNFQL